MSDTAFPIHALWRSSVVTDLGPEFEVGLNLD